MGVYVFNIILICLWAFLFLLTNNFNSIRGRKAFVWIISIQLIILQGLRHYTVGTDVRTYLNVYNGLKNGGYQEFASQRFEIGYKLINKLIGVIGLNEQLFLFVISALILVPIAIFIYRNSYNLFISFYSYIAFGFFGASFNTLRQNIAYGIILLSFTFIKQKRLIAFILTVLFASTFHISALVFLPAYYLARIKLNKINILIIASISLLIFLFRRQILLIITNNIFYNYDLVETNANLWMIFNALLFIGAMIYYPFNNNRLERKRKDKNDNSTVRMYYSLTLIGVILMIFTTVTNNAMRIANYYHIFIILLIPAVIKNIENKYIRFIITMLFIVGITAVYIYFLTTPSDHNYVPYKFFWE